MQNQIKSVKVTRVSQGQNSHADLLATLASLVGGIIQRIISVELVDLPSIFRHEGNHVLRIQASPSWIDPIVAYIFDGNPFEDKKEAKKVRRKSSRYWLSTEKKHYKCLYDRPYILYVHADAVNSLLYELHEGICGSRTRSLNPLSHLW